MSTVKANTFQDASGGSTATINGMTPTADSLQGFRNRIINGDMRIDQRNAGASVTPTTNTYTLDRWNSANSVTSKYTVQQNAGSVTPPAGFKNYLGATSSSAYSVGSGEYFSLVQPIEGFNVADLGWGAAGAATVTLSFWVRSSLTGTFGGAFNDSVFSRSYPFSYTISAANTWELKSVTVAGDTSGTWLTTNGVGIFVRFSLGSGATVSGTAGSWAGAAYTSATGATSVVGTNGATFYITGVQLEVGSVATPFERRPYGMELALCLRYYEKSYRQSVAVPTNSSLNGFSIAVPNKNLTGSTTNERVQYIVFNESKRAAPTITFYTLTNSTAGSWEDGGGAAIAMATNGISETGFACFNNANVSTNTQLAGHWVASSEL